MQALNSSVLNMTNNNISLADLSKLIYCNKKIDDVSLMGNDKNYTITNNLLDELDKVDEEGQEDTKEVKGKMKEMLKEIEDLKNENEKLEKKIKKWENKLKDYMKCLRKRQIK